MEIPSEIECDGLSSRVISTEQILPGRRANIIELLDRNVPGSVVVNSNDNGGAFIVGDIQSGTTIWNDTLHTSNIDCRNSLCVGGGLSVEGNVSIKGMSDVIMPASSISASSITLLDNSPGNGMLSCSDVNAYGTHTQVFSVKNASTIEGWTDVKSHIQVWP